MRESLVGFCHLVGIFALLDGAANVVGSVDELGGQASGHGLFTTAAAVQTGSDGLKYLAAALSTGLGSIAAGIAVGAGAPAAIGAISENEKSFSKALIFVALGEGVAIYGLLISILILFG